MSWVAVFMGGGLGSVVRYFIAHWMTQYKLDFAWATVLANLTSSIILGILMGYTIRGSLGGQWSFFWMVGFCGGFSTFSTFTAETLMFMQEGQWSYAFANILLSVIICLLGLWAGLRLIS
ncbi:MAG: fluoride efflux transporter CrcB [Saprospiraceae bacterium]|nr:fluoride efflux transporter CrcB [Saprospiraceae bacterium]